PDRRLDRKPRIEQVQCRSQQNFRHEQRRQKEGFHSFAPEKPEAHQPQGGAGPEDRRQRRREQANDEAHSEEGGDKSRAGEERLAHSEQLVREGDLFTVHYSYFLLPDTDKKK